MLKLSALVAVLVLILCCGSSCLAVEYRMIDLGNVGAYDINDNGQALLKVATPNGSDTSVTAIWQNGQVTYIPQLGSNFYPTAINNNGDISGRILGSDGISRAAVWRNGSLTTIFDKLSDANDINDFGQVTGTLYEGEYKCYIWNDGATTYAAKNDGGYKRGISINNYGVVVGNRDYYGDSGLTQTSFIWQNDMYNRMEQFNGLDTIAKSINDNGQVVGYGIYEGADAGYHKAFVWQNGTYTDLSPYFLARYDSEALDINNKGQIVGCGSIDLLNSGTRAVLISDGVVVDLGKGCAEKINEQGQIIGRAWIGSVQHAVLWQPVPEPASLLSLLSGIGAMLAVRSGRRR